jgi:hypothetical protein
MTFDVSGVTDLITTAAGAAAILGAAVLLFVAGIRAWKRLRGAS